MSASVVRRFSAGVVLSSVTIAGWLTWSLHQNHVQLARERTSLLATPKPPERAPKEQQVTTSIEEELSETRRRLAEVEVRIAMDRATQQAAEFRAAELEKQMPSDDEVTSSLGRIEDLGRATSAFIRGALPQLIHETTGRKMEPHDLAAKTLFQFLSAMPQLQAMEDDPAELSRFHGALLSDLFDLDDAATERVLAAVGPEFDQLRMQGLTISRRPAQNPIPWETRRDIAIRGMASRIARFLPPLENRERLLEAALSITGGPRGKAAPAGDNSELKLFFPGFGQGQGG